MEPLVSVIIPEFEDETYLIRCIDSLKRQTYKKIDIYIGNSLKERLNDEDNIHFMEQGNFIEKIIQAIYSSQGKFIFFCRVGTVLSPNVLQKLVEQTHLSSTTCFQTPYYDATSEQFNEIKEVDLTPYGKIFYREKLLEHLHEMETALNPFDFFSMVQYFDHNYKEIEILQDTAIYDSFPRNLYKEYNDVNAWMNKISSLGVLKQINIREDVKKLVIEVMLENMPICSEKVRFMSLIADIYPNDLEENFLLIKKYLKNIYIFAKEKKDKEIFNEIEKYINLWSKNEKFLKLILSYLNISSREAQLYFSDAVSEMIFFENHAANGVENEKLTRKIEIIDKELEDIKQKIDNLKKCELKPINKKAVNETSMEEMRTDILNSLNGNELVDFVVQKYLKGNLGFRTIIISIKAWMKYKRG